jgi:hypothetical protein
MAYLMVLRTASMFGLQLCGSDGAFPPRWYERLPLLLVSVCSDRLFRYVAHSEQLKRKCSTVSLACPQAHQSVSTAPIWYRYPLSRAMPVRSCESTHASFRPRASYSFRVCRPGIAASIFFICFPTRSGSVLYFRLSAFAVLISVALALSSCFCRSLPSSVALRAAFFASLPSWNPSCAGTHLE